MTSFRRAEVIYIDAYVVLFLRPVMIWAAYLRERSRNSCSAWESESIQENDPFSRDKIQIYGYSYI